MPYLANACAVLGILLGLTGLVAFEGFCLAGMPNGSPETLRNIKRLMLVGGIVGLLLLIAAVWLMVGGKPWWSAGTGVSPLIVLTVALIAVSLWG